MKETIFLLPYLLICFFLSVFTVPRKLFLRVTVDLNVTEAGCIDDTTQTGGVATGAITRRSHHHDECEGKENLNGMDANLHEDH